MNKNRILRGVIKVQVDIHLGILEKESNKQKSREITEKEDSDILHFDIKMEEPLEVLPRRIENRLSLCGKVCRKRHRHK